jgi:hypothetical protein
LPLALGQTGDGFGEMAKSSGDQYQGRPTQELK